MRGGRFIILFGGQKIGIALSGQSFVQGSAQGTVIGNLSVIGGAGVYTFGLVNSGGTQVQLVGNQIQVGPSVAGLGNFNIIVSASGGLIPVPNQTLTITVVSAAQALLADVGSPILADVGSPILVQ